MDANRDEIVLIRHGRSAHVHTGWIDLHGFHRWREAYEAAGVLAGEVPPSELRVVAERAGAVVASDAPRAIESARLLTSEGEVITSPLLRELDLPPPSLRWVRLPLAGWALAFGARWLFRALTSRQHASPVEITRAHDAARWLAELTRRHGSVVAVTHASFRGLLAETLIAAGWHIGVRPRGVPHWSAWSLTRPRER